MKFKQIFGSFHSTFSGANRSGWKTEKRWLNLANRLCLYANNMATCIPLLPSHTHTHAGTLCQTSHILCILTVLSNACPQCVLVCVCIGVPAGKVNCFWIINYTQRAKNSNNNANLCNQPTMMIQKWEWQRATGGIDGAMWPPPPQPLHQPIILITHRKNIQNNNRLTIVSPHQCQ